MNHRALKVPLLILTLITLSLPGCRQASSDEQTFEKKIGIPITNYTKISYPQYLNHNTATKLILTIENATKDCLVFPYDYGTRIFIFKNNGWVELPNNIDFANHNDLVLDPPGKAEAIPDGLIFIDPDYSQLGTMPAQQRLRIVVMGHLCANGKPSTEKFAEYLEISK